MVLADRAIPGSGFPIRIPQQLRGSAQPCTRATIVQQGQGGLHLLWGYGIVQGLSRILCPIMRLGWGAQQDRGRRCAEVGHVRPPGILAPEGLREGIRAAIEPSPKVVRLTPNLPEELLRLHLTVHAALASQHACILALENMCLLRIPGARTSVFIIIL